MVSWESSIREAEGARHGDDLTHARALDGPSPWQPAYGRKGNQREIATSIYLANVWVKLLAEA
jgi:hypothetical protein